MGILFPDVYIFLLSAHLTNYQWDLLFKVYLVSIIFGRIILIFVSYNRIIVYNLSD